MREDKNSRRFLPPESSFAFLAMHEERERAAINQAEEDVESHSGLMFHEFSCTHSPCLCSDPNNRGRPVMSDVKALADWIRAAAPFDPENWGQYQDQLDAAADALEASEAERDRIMAEWTRAEAELEASVQAPAVVDRLAAIEAIHGAVAAGPGVAGKAVDSLFASGILQDAAEVEARGLEKAAEQMPEGGMTSESWDGVRVEYATHERSPRNLTPQAWLRARAQQVREGN